jgi:hypothetical protein
VYIERPDGSLRFRWVKAPTSAELAGLTQTLARRIGRFLERQGLLERDADSSYLVGDVLEPGPMEQLLGLSITYRIAVGPQQGRKVFTLQTLPACDDSFDDGVGKVSGFSLHAGVAARADQRQKLERLCRYISRPAASEKRLSLTPNGNVRYQLKTPYRDETTHVIFEQGGLPPLDFIARLAALVPKPRVNLTRFHGVFARGGLPPNSKHRAQVTPAKRGKGGRDGRGADPEERTPVERRAAMTWAQRLKRVFGIDPNAARSRPVRPAVGRIGSSPVSKTRWLSRRFSITSMRKWLGRKPPGGRRAERHHSGGFSTRRGDPPRLNTFGLRHQRRGNGGGWPGGWRTKKKGPLRGLPGGVCASTCRCDAVRRTSGRANAGFDGRGLRRFRWSVGGKYC